MKKLDFIKQKKIVKWILILIFAPVLFGSLLLFFDVSWFAFLYGAMIGAVLDVIALTFTLAIYFSNKVKQII